MKEWGLFALKHGPLALIAAFLVYAVVIDSRREHRDIGTELAAMRDQVRGVTAIVAQSHMIQDRTLYVLRRICVNDARTLTDRDACLKDQE